MNKVYLAPTKKEWNRIVGQALKDGYKWRNESKVLNTDDWNEYTKNSVLFLYKNKTISFGNKSLAEVEYKNDPNYDLTWIDDTQEMIDKLKSKGYRVEKDEFPKKKEVYWYVNGDKVFSSNWDEFIVDIERKNGLGVYRTKELANEAFNKMKEIAKEIMKKN